MVCHVLPVVVDGLPIYLKFVGEWNILKNLMPQLADPSFELSGKVDLLIGAREFFNLFEPVSVWLQAQIVSSACKFQGSIE